MCESSTREAGALSQHELMITPAMIDEGVDAYLNLDRECEEARTVVIEVYRRMHLLDRK